VTHVLLRESRLCLWDRIGFQARAGVAAAGNALVVAHVGALHPEDHVFAMLVAWSATRSRLRLTINAFSACGARWLCSSITLVSDL